MAKNKRILQSSHGSPKSIVYKSEVSRKTLFRMRKEQRCNWDMLLSDPSIRTFMDRAHEEISRLTIDLLGKSSLWVVEETIENCVLRLINAFSWDLRYRTMVSKWTGIIHVESKREKKGLFLPYQRFEGGKFTGVGRKNTVLVLIG